MALDSCLWYDEIETLVNYVRLPTNELVTTYSSLNNHILYSLLAQLSVGVFGESAWALRLPAMLLGVASIAACWWLATQVISRREAAFCAVLMTVSYHHIWFSQNARGYTGLLFCTLVATSLFLKGTREPSRRVWFAYAIVFALAMYMHLSAVFVFATHALVYAGMLLLRGSGGREATGEKNWQPIFGFALGGLLTLLLYAVLIPQMIDSFTGASGPVNHAEVKEWKNPLWTIAETINNFRQNGVLYSIGLPVAGLLMAVGIGSLARRQTVFSLIALLHVPLTAAVLFATSFRIWPRYFFVDGGFAILFLIHGTFIVAEFLADKFGLRKRFHLSGGSIGAGFAASMAVCSLFMLPRYYQLPKQDFLGAKNYVESARLPGDVAAAVGLASSSFNHYYAPDWEVVETRKQLDQLRDNGRTVWLVYSFESHTAAKYPEVFATIQSDFILEKEFPGTLSGGWVFVYRTSQK